MIQFSSEEEMMVWMLAMNGRASEQEKPGPWNQNDLAKYIAEFADEMVEEFRKRIPMYESK